MTTKEKKALKKRLAGLTTVVLLAGAIGGGVAISYANHPTKEAPVPEHTTSSLLSFAARDTSWTVDELREDGLRIIPTGRTDASAVLEPERFTGKTRHAYWIATQIPEVLNQLYRWCGCENRGVHRSNLACFEDGMGENCAVCQGTAEIAYEMLQRGITDAGEIQAAVDAQWGPKT